MSHCLLLWQHMDGSYCVKPLKQKQVVNAQHAFPLFPSFLLLCNISFMLLKDKDAPKLYFRASRLTRETCSFYSSTCSYSQVDGVSYLLQEIYGIENKYNSQESKVGIR